jgi:hypothetical protein
MGRRGKEFQFSLFIPKTTKVFGGSLLKGNPKQKRPISTKHAMHLVLRSSLAIYNRSLLKHRSQVDRIIRNQAEKFGVRLYRYENVGNHIHLLVKTGHRFLLIRFLRSVSGLIARTVLKAERGTKRLGSNELTALRFWDARPYSRVVEWGRAYKNMCDYMDKNKLQAIGFDLSFLAKHLETVGCNTS